VDGEPRRFVRILQDVLQPWRQDTCAQRVLTRVLRRSVLPTLQVTQELRTKIRELQTPDGRTNLSRAISGNVLDLIGMAAQGGKQYAVNPVTFAIHQTTKVRLR
jgi:hypothetical protein